MFGLFRGWIESAKYENQIIEIKRDHFSRFAKIEDEKHELSLKVRKLEVEHKGDIDTLETKYKLEVQELVSKNEKELSQAEHTVKLEKEKWEVQKEKLNLQHQQDLSTKKLEAEQEHHEKLRILIEREGKADKSVVTSMMGILDRLQASMPNVNWSENRQTGSPVLKIEKTTVKEK